MANVATILREVIVKPIPAALLVALLLAACQSAPSQPDYRGSCRYPGQSPECRGLHTGAF